jgi:hypothetical protein
MLFRQLERVALQLLDTKQFRAQNVSILVVMQPFVCPPEKS